MSSAIANPAPLGLFGFGVTTVLLNFENAGISEKTLLNLVLSHGFFYGGLAQFCAGMWEFATGNTFGATAFTSYGAFWISLAAFIWAHEGGLFAGAQELDMFLYFCTWGALSAGLWLITFRISKALTVVFGSLVLLFALLAIGEYSTVIHKMQAMLASSAVALVLLFALLAIGEYSTVIHKIAGYVGLFCGGSAIYTGYATLLNATWKGNFLPLGPYVAPSNEEKPLV
eukprot:CAMPEP_0194782666 /NCGR_PEP_ID=MMETSP0323_2-20130528/78814_1 /TAXON_ID=2866 ORGANISM="Crypthecodinium cohnii, Strain Seligo" /NCGR_SAMPLE_ID=MMETSP0323_2 /ASSEMBLY_ACC=CAM_ASM_000346 /LENGTH=227 /DNA_ID=CAMNT_0039721499 /DNA_START=85 /DNA_END=769 /DNA_ORIENTATION=+